mgnify:CR=1 FL=1
MAQNAYNAVAAAHPDSVKYKANYERLTARLNTLDNSVRTICADARTHRFIINHPALRHIPFFLETPNELDGYAAEITQLKALYRAD